MSPIIKQVQKLVALIVFILFSINVFGQNSWRYSTKIDFGVLVE